MGLQLPPQLEQVWNQAVDLWQAGGWAMIAIAATALIMFFVGANIYLKLVVKRFEMSWRSALIISVLVCIGVIVNWWLNRPPDTEVRFTLSAFTTPSMLNKIFILLGVAAAVVTVRLALSYFMVAGCKDWPNWISDPDKRHGPVGKLLDFVTGGKDIKQTKVFFKEVESTEVKPFARDLLVMKICVAAAPLLGLLGTVTGMIATFNALREGSGGDQTQDMVAQGISEALITTETGLVIALAGLFFQYQLARKHQRYRAFIAHVETATLQKMHRKHAPGPTD